MKIILTVGSEKILLQGNPKTEQLFTLVDLLRGAKPVKQKGNYCDQREFEKAGKEIEYVSGDVIFSDQIEVQLNLLSDGAVFTLQEFEAACDLAKKNAKQKVVAG